ncbi:MAG: hypothetical protein ACRENJ_00675, partial [Candidatus Eiseniibacteriota bacterium]
PVTRCHRLALALIAILAGAPPAGAGAIRGSIRVPPSAAPTPAMNAYLGLRARRGERDDPPAVTAAGRAA